MTVLQQSQTRTRMFSRVLGPFLVIVALAVALRTGHMNTLLTQFTATEVWPWVTGAFILVGGIAIVAFHQYWRSPAAVIVSVLGWVLVARGVLLLAFPDVFTSLANRMIGATVVWQVSWIVMGVIGLYLTYVGWRPVSATEIDVHHVSKDLPHAA
ncbi:hypothetical protein Mycch_1479 [Mycolicibacterium chubuense NBB4]|uniref:Uncharacterized protein n=1 Tax=Mycolicibacterium chubuense (strain NBB4) TaxID=710421 RepID=I4BG72_MYCCN|nr:membrane protein [Mycolicibacterium chubuense]AFM16279.1 hypothetical protein Mycch_1479 [Mycolicibacterium chubuense NBB4]